MGSNVLELPMLWNFQWLSMVGRCADVLDHFDGVLEAELL